MRKRYTIREWEEAIVGRPDIRFEKMRLSEGFVWDVIGTVTTNGRDYVAYWLENGKCFCQLGESTRFDIKFRAND